MECSSSKRREVIVECSSSKRRESGESERREREKKRKLGVGQDSSVIRVLGL